MSINRHLFENHIKSFQFKKLFNELGWDNVIKNQPIMLDGKAVELIGIAQKRDFIILECPHGLDGNIPKSDQRKKIIKQISKLFFEHLIIFTDQAKTRQV